MLRLLQNIPLGYYALSSFVNFVTAFTIPLIVFLSKKKSKANKIFATFSFSVAYWSLLYFVWVMTKNKEWAEFYLRSCMIGVLFMPSLFIHFVVSFLNLKINKKFILTNYILSILFMFTVYTPLYARDVGRHLVFPYWLHTGPIFHLALVHFGAVVLYSFYLMWQSIKKEKGIFRNQILYIFIGTGIGYISGITNFFCWYRINIPPFLNIFISVYVIMVAVAVLKYNLMDIDLARRYAIVHLSYGVTSLLIFIPFILLLRYSLWGVIITAFLIILITPYFHRWMTKFLEPAFLGGTYRTRQELDRLKEVDLGYISEQIAWNLVEGIAEIMQVVKISFFMFVKTRREFRPQAQLGLDDEIGVEPIPWITLKPENALVRYLADSKKPLIEDEFIREASGTDSVVQEMQHLHSEVSIPLFVRGELRGVLNLGPKSNQEMYHQEELRKLTELCHQAENHLSHALFMEERTSFSRDLAHDMKNLVVKAIEPTFAELCSTHDEKKKQEILKTLFNQHQYLKICLMHNFDLVSLLEKLVYHKYTLEPAQIAGVISGCASLYKDSFTKAGVSIELDLPKNLPLVLVNKEDIPKVFNNLFDNALKFTPSGGKIKILAEQKEDEVLITFSDTGRGIAKEELEHIFEPELKMPEETEIGTGLGLVIVRDIIEAHQGRIWVESEPNKGTTFYFTLRIAKGKESDTDE